MLFVLLKIASVLDYNTGDMMDFAKEAPVNQDNSEWCFYTQQWDFWLMAAKSVKPFQNKLKAQNLEQAMHEKRTALVTELASVSGQSNELLPE